MSQRALKSQLVIVSAVLATLGLPLASHAESSPAVPVSASPVSDIETSKYSFVGGVNSDGTLTRSGPSENEYQTLKLAKGTRLTVVGMRFDWLKIVPPEGSFCLVPQAYIDKAGDGTTGRVINKGAPVRVGSALTLATHHVLPRLLGPGETVKIIGETPSHEFYKITPPADVFVYVDKKFVNPVQPIDSGGKPTLAQPVKSDERADGAGGSAGVPTTAQPIPGAGAAIPEGATAAKENEFTVKSPAPEGSAAAIASATATANSIKALQDKLSKLEDRFMTASQLELSKQPIDALVKDYGDLLADKQLPPNARKVAEYRAGQLKTRQDVVAEDAITKKQQEVAAQKQKDLKAEQDELAARVAAVEIKRYAAIGTLLPSSLQVGDKPLYRLIDPATRQLIIYVRATKTPVADGVDKFIALNGQIVQDDATHMTYLQPDTFEVVDPKLFNTKIFADYSPPSMATANITGEASAR